MSRQDEAERVRKHAIELVNRFGVLGGILKDDEPEVDGEDFEAPLSPLFRAPSAQKMPLGIGRGTFPKPR